MVKIKKQVKVFDKRNILVQYHRTPITLEEYMFLRWFKTVEEEEKMLFSRNMIVFNIFFNNKNSR